MITGKRTPVDQHVFINAIRNVEVKRAIVQRSAAERQGQRKSSGCYDSQKTSNHSIENEFPPFILFFIRLELDPPR